MNTGEEDLLSGLNGRLRPRKSTIPSPQIKATRKSDHKVLQDKSKKNDPSKTSLLCQDDLPEKLHSSQALDFLCPYCDKKFVSKQTVFKHARRMHLSTSKQDSFFGCLFCNHTESDPNDIIRHMVDSHPNQYFACFDCHTRFSSTSELAEHKLNICEKQKPYRSKLRPKSSDTKKNSKALTINCKSDYHSKNKEYACEPDYNGIVISCELKPSQFHDAADIEDNITTNLILPSNKTIANNNLLEKNAVIVLDDIQWNKRLPPNFTFHNTDADQILSRLGVIHRTPRSGESTRRDWFKSIEDSTQKIDKCFDTGFFAKVASNVQENLTKFLDGTFNFNPDSDNAIKTRKAKNSAVINTVEGFPILLSCEQYSRNVFDGYLPRAITSKHKYKWGSLDNGKTLVDPDQFKRDTHTNNCIISLVSSLDIWTQLCMRRKFEDKFCHSLVEKKVEKRHLVDKELKEILESRDLPVVSPQNVKYTNKSVVSAVELEFPASLGLTPLTPQYQVQPAILSGEWVRPRCYVCCACGAQTRDARALTSHISTQHPNAQVQHYEIVGETLLNADIIKHLYVPPSQLSNRTRPLRGFRECTKCKIPASLEDLHQHMLDCAGDMPTVRRKCRYRPFGVRRRRPRLPDNTIRKKIRKDIRNRQRQKGYIRSRARPRIKTEVGDAETIRKMLADLPAKRHRVMVNPINSILRPRRKFDLQRNKLLMKRRPSDDPQNRVNRKLRSKDVCNLRNIGEPNKKKLTNIEYNGNKSMRSKMTHMSSNGIGQNESFKKPTIFKRAKRSIKKNIHSDDKDYDPDESINDDPAEGLPDEWPQRIDVNGSPHKMKEHSGGHEETNSSSNGSNPKGGGYDPGGGGYSPSKGGYNPPNGDGSDSNNGKFSGGRENGDIKPVQNSPLKHSIARLTANSETHDKSVQFHHLFLVQQECNNVTEHAPTGQRELFENEAVVTKLDKPPLHYPKGCLDSHSLQKIKVNKPRKGLNDCIAMLKNKLVDPPSRSLTDQISVQCGNDDPIESVHCPPKTIIESGINMTPAQIFYRPILPQSTMLSNNMNFQNFSAYSYATSGNLPTITRAEKPKIRQKKLSHNCDKPLLKEKQDESVAKRKSTRLKSVARAQIELQHDLMRLPPQIEIIPQPSLNFPNMKPTRVRSCNQYESSESNLMLNQQMLDYVMHQNRRASVDSKTQNKKIQKKCIVVPPVTTMSHESQINLSERQYIAHKSLGNNIKTQQTNQTQAIYPESTSEKTYEAKSQYKTKNLSNNIYSNTNNIDESSRITPTYSVITIDSIVSTPLDLSGKYVTVSQTENALQMEPAYSTTYDSYGTLDLSNKGSYYLKTIKESTVSDIVVDLSIKPTTQLIPAQTNVNVYNNAMEHISNTVTDLSTSRREIDHLPTDLSMKAIDIRSCQSSMSNLSYEVEDLSGCKHPTASKHRLLYADLVDTDKDIPTDLSGKANKNSSDLIQTSVNLKGNENRLKDKLNFTRNDDLPADLSTKSKNENQTTYSKVLEAKSNDPIETIQDTNITNSSTSPIADIQPDYVLKPVCETFADISQYEIRNMTQSEATGIIESEDCDTIIHPSDASSIVGQVSETLGYEQILNTSSVTWQHIYNADMTPQERLSYECTPEHLNVTVSPNIGSIPVYSLPNLIQTHCPVKFESTRPVYTLPNTCISITKIESSNSTTLTNSLLSIPGTTIANTTSVYTLAGTSVGTPINYGIMPQTVNDIRHIIGNSSLLNSLISPTSETNTTNNQYNLSANISGDSKNSYSSIEADLDPETASKVAKLPKEIVDILGTMPIDHRKQLINILPHYVSTSESGSSSLATTKNRITTDIDISRAPLSDVTSNKKIPYLQVQTADSTSGPKNNIKLNAENIFHNNISENQANMDVKLIPLPPSPPPSTYYHTVINGSAEFVNSEHANFYNDDVTKEDDYNDFKVIDLTEDDNIDADLVKEVDNVDLVTPVTGSELKNKVIPKGNKNRANDQTASLRAVRIKAPSERQKTISNGDNVLFKNPNNTIKESVCADDIKESDKLTIKESGVNIKDNSEYNFTIDSHVDIASKDEQHKNPCELITVKIDVDPTSQTENIRSAFNGTTILEKDVICTQRSNIQGDLNMTSTNIKTSTIMEEEVINNTTSSSKKNIENINLEVTSNDCSVSAVMNTNKENFVAQDEHAQLSNPLCDNKKDASGGDDSEDDILLAVIVKQRRETQTTNKSENKVSNDDNINIKPKNVIEPPITCDESVTTNNIPFKTNMGRKQHGRNSKNKNSSRKLNYNNGESNILFENEQNVDTSLATKANENLNSEVNAIQKKSTKNLNTIDKFGDIKKPITPTIEKIDMGVQYECLDKEFYNDGICIIDDNMKLYNKNSLASNDNVKIINQLDDRNVIVENNDNRLNIKDTKSEHTCLIIDKMSLLHTSSNEIQNFDKILEIRSEIEKTVQTEADKNDEKTNESLSHRVNVIDEYTKEDEISECKSNKYSTDTKCSTNTDKEKTRLPLRRSRRGKSLFVENNITLDEGNDAFNSDLFSEHKTHLTKKQLIFSKLLLDGENHCNIPDRSTLDIDNETQKDYPRNIEIENNDTISQNLNTIEVSPSDNNYINKTKKRRNSSLTKRKIKKKKSLQIMDTSDSDDSLQLIKTSMSEKKSANDPETTNTNVADDGKDLMSFKGTNDDEQIESTTLRLDLIPKPTVEENATVTESTLKVCLSLSGVECSVNCEKLSISTEKRKLILPTVNTDGESDSKSNRTKTKSKNKTATSAVYDEDGNLQEEVVLQQEIRIFPNIEPRTTCYNRSVAIKRTRSKSVIVKSINNDLIYDPYDINLDDMIANSEPLDKKRLKYDEPTSSNELLKLNQLKNHLISEEVRKRDPSLMAPTSQSRKMKKSVKVRDRLKRGKRSKNNSSDSDDSSKSDVPLTQYVKQRVKRSKKSHDAILGREDIDINLTGIVSSDKEGNPGCRDKRPTLVTYNNADTVSSLNETEERLRSEQFMESFGFFSERKPRKSNLLAAKKISETFHIIANESDDAYVGYRERAIKRALQNENKKAKEGECSRQQGSAVARKVPRRGGKKKKLCTKVIRRGVCQICKKDFRRTDNCLRHNFNLYHLTTLSEELQIKISPLFEEPNYLIVYKQHIDRLKIITDKLAKKEKISKVISKITLPTVTEILIEVNRVVREQILSQRGLSRDEALFLHCCELLKESRISNADPHMLNSNYSCPQATLTGLALIEKQIDEDKDDYDVDGDSQILNTNYICPQATLDELALIEKQININRGDSKSDGDVDSITAKNILESEEVRNLENDLILNLKEAALANKAHNTGCLLYRNTADNIAINTNITSNQTIPDYNNFEQTSEKMFNTNEPSTSKLKKPEVKRMMYPDVIEDIDMYEDKFDKIKRKCRSQAAAAKQIQSIVEPSTSYKTRKKSDKKKVKKNIKKKHQSTQVPTKGALKGFDVLKVSIPHPKPSKCANSHERSKKKRKRCGSKKKRDKKYSESSSKHETDHRVKDTSITHKKVDVYEFMDNEDAELFEFRPSTLMERFKNITTKAGPSTSKVNSAANVADYSSPSVSDGDDFVYMSDDYVGSDDDSANSMTYEPVNNKMANDLKKTITSLKRKDVVDKNAVMGKIFKHNALRTEKKCAKYKENVKGQSNLDQLFDSLLKNEPGSSANNSTSSKLTDHSTEYISEYDETAFQNLSPRNNNNVSPTNSPKQYHVKSPKHYDSSLKKYGDYFEYAPTKSKKREKFLKIGFHTESKKHCYISQDQHDISPKTFYKATHFNNDSIESYDQVPFECNESTPKRFDTSIKSRHYTNDKAKVNSSLKMHEGNGGTSYDYVTELYDQASNDEAGVARQRARRKCTVGKQKVLAETWSSESEPDGVPQRPDSAESEKSDSGRKKRSRKKDKHHSNGRRGSNRNFTFRKQNDGRVNSNRNHSSADVKRSQIDDNTSGSGGNWLDHYKNTLEEPSGSGLGSYRTSYTIASSSSSTAYSNKAQPRYSPYFSSSDQDDDQEHLQQHGWIVGDSHKKLVTMLAHAKGRKRNNDDKHNLVE